MLPKSSGNSAQSVILTSRHVRILAILILGTFLTLLFFNTASRPLALELDSSGQALFEYYAHNGAQFGKDAVHVVGPYGYVLYHTGYSGVLSFQKILFNLLLKAVFAWLLLELVSRSGRPVVSALLLLSLAAFGSRMQDDFVVTLTQLFAGILLLLLLEDGIGPWRALFASGFLGFSCLLKGTHAVNSLVIIVLFSAACVLRRKWAELWPVLLSFAAVMVGAWILAGQSLHLLPHFWITTFVVGSTYNEANALAEQTLGVFKYGLLAATCLSVSIIGHAALSAREFRTAVAAAMLASFSFLEWKHGFVRADGHVQSFFHYGLVIAAFVPLAMAPRQSKGASRHWMAAPVGRWFSFVATALLAFFSLCGAQREPFARLILANVPTELGNRISHNVRVLSNLPGWKARLDAGLEENRKRHELPRMKRLIGNGKADFFGVNLGVMLLNGFNYRPRPVAPAFEAHGEYLMRLNQQFIADRTQRPDYILLPVETMDNRLLSHDDTLTLNYILHNYYPIFFERNYYLLTCHQNPEPPEPVAVSTVTAAPAQWVVVPRRAGDEVLLASVKAGVTIRGSIRSFVYRPPICNLEIAFSGGSVRRHRLLLENSRVPFVIDPPLHDQFDFYRYFHMENAAEVERIRVVTESPADLLFLKSEVTIQFSKLKRKTIEPRYSPLPGFNKAPVELRAFATGIVQDTEGRDALYLHAPGEIVFKCEPTVSHLSGRIGILPGAYSATDGVEFIVTLERERQKPAVLWRRLLEPATRPADRGTQDFSVRIPAGARRVVRIQTTTGGPGRNSAADQSYISDVQFW